LSGPRRIVFVARNFTGESLRSARAITQLDDVELFGVCEQALEIDGFREVVRVADTHDSVQLLEAAKQLQQKYGPLNRIVTTYETLLEPVAQTVETLRSPRHERRHCSSCTQQSVFDIDSQGSRNRYGSKSGLYR
jgi:hypothetical protein